MEIFNYHTTPKCVNELLDRNNIYIITHKTNQRLLSWGYNNIFNFITDISTKMKNINFLENINITESYPTVPPAKNSDGQVDVRLFYNLNAITTFNKGATDEKYLTDGQQRLSAIISTLSILKNIIKSLSDNVIKTSDNEELKNKLKTNVDKIKASINKSIYAYEDGFDTMCDEMELLPIRMQYDDMVNYNNLFVRLINGNINLIKDEFSTYEDDNSNDSNKLNHYYVYYKPLLERFINTDEIINEMISHIENDIDKINYLCRFYLFLERRTFLVEQLNDKYDPIESTIDFVLKNMRSDNVNDFDKYKAILNINIDKTLSVEEINKNINNIFLFLEKSRLNLGEDFEQFNSLLKLNYEIKIKNKFQSKENIVSDIENILKNQKNVDSIEEVKYLLETSEIISSFRNNGRLPDIIVNKFKDIDTLKFEELQSLSEDLYALGRKYSEKFICIICKEIKYFNFPEILYTFKRFIKFILEYSELGSGGQGASLADDKLLEFHAIIHLNDKLIRFEEILNNESIKNDIGLDKAVDKWFKMRYTKSAGNNKKIMTILRTIEYHLIGGFTQTHSQINLKKSNTIEHCNGQKHKNPNCNMLGNLTGIITNSTNSKLADTFKEKLLGYKKSSSPLLKNICDKYSDKEEFSTECIIENTGFYLMKYLEATHCLSTPNPKKLTFTLDENKVNKLKKLIDNEIVKQNSNNEDNVFIPKDKVKKSVNRKGDTFSLKNGKSEVIKTKGRPRKLKPVQEQITIV